MRIIIRFIKTISTMFISLVLLIVIAVFIVFNHVQNSAGINKNVTPFQLNSNNISYDKSRTSSNKSINILTNNVPNLTRQDVLNRARAMVQVRWIPKHNIFDKYGRYVFIKGKTYYGIPYSMNLYQVSSVNDFLSKISNSRILYGNDCSGFVSTAWGISRQTTLTLLDAVNSGSEIQGKAVRKISWNDLKPGDALLIDNGKGEGHIMLYINTDARNSNKINVYEQNVQTIHPFESLPVAREDYRYKSKLIRQGYIPIRLMTLN
ncbi:MAG: NlpC/P60 family protein [Clostridium sp.]|nr:NlpC/P60 family protein [Clostridium sp.]